MTTSNIVGAITIGALRNQLEALPVVAGALRRRLASAPAPATFDGWPLGYKVQSFSQRQATVSVWHLDLAASSTLALVSAGYTTTTYELRWTAGTWRIQSASSFPGPTPPPADAPSVQIDHFANAVAAFSTYRYVP